MKKYWWILIIVVVLIGVSFYICLPRYKVIEVNRSLALGNQPSNFIMSPAKIEITNLVWGFPLTIPVKIVNSAGDINYTIGFQDPSIFDNGYVNADGYEDYLYSWDKSTILVKNNTSEVVRIKISKNGWVGSSGIEKGIAISQLPSNSIGTSFNFSYIFEILIH